MFLTKPSRQVWTKLVITNQTFLNSPHPSLTTLLTKLPNCSFPSLGIWASGSHEPSGNCQWHDEGSFPPGAASAHMSPPQKQEGSRSHVKPKRALSPNLHSATRDCEGRRWRAQMVKAPMVSNVPKRWLLREQTPVSWERVYLTKGENMVGKDRGG